MSRRVPIDHHPARTSADNPAFLDDHRAVGLITALDGEPSADRFLLCATFFYALHFAVYSEKPSEEPEHHGQS